MSLFIGHLAFQPLFIGRLRQKANFGENIQGDRPSDHFDNLAVSGSGLSGSRENAIFGNRDDLFFKAIPNLTDIPFLEAPHTPDGALSNRRCDEFGLLRPMGVLRPEPRPSAEPYGSTISISGPSKVVSASMTRPGYISFQFLQWPAAGARIHAALWF